MVITEQKFTARQLADLTGGSLHDCPPDRVLHAVKPLPLAGAADVSFLHNPKYAAQVKTSKAGLFIVPAGSGFAGLPRIEAKDAHRATAQVLQALYPAARPAPGISPLASVHATAQVDPAAAVLPFVYIGSRAKISAGAVIHPFVHVGADCVIGENAVLHPGATLYAETLVGANSIIHAGVILGADGFGFALSASGHLKVPQIGRTRIGDQVEIGANSTVDRAALGETLIKDGAKIDNLVMVAHNVIVGEGSVLVAQSGISGSTTLGPGVIIAGQSGAVGHITLGAGARVGAKSAVTRDVAPGEFVTGHPARKHSDWLKQQALIEKLPELRLQVKALVEKIESLENRAPGPGPRASGKTERTARPRSQTRGPRPAAPKPARAKKSKPKSKTVRAKKR